MTTTETAEVRHLRPAPASIESERALLGALMLDPKCWPRVAARIGEDDFFRTDHRRIFAAVARLQQVGNAADPVSVRDDLERAGQIDEAGGAEYVAQLVSETPSAANVETYARTVRDQALRRRYLATLGELQQQAFDPGEASATELIADAGQKLLGLHTDSRSGRGLVEGRVIVSELLDELARRHAGERGLAIGLSDFDRLTYGLDPGDLVVIGARPGMGKTAWLVSIAAHVSREAGAAIFSAEMPARQLMRRCVSLLSGVEQGKLRDVEELDAMDWCAIDEAAAAVTRRHLTIDDTPAPSLTHIRAETLARAVAGNLGIVLVDYVQLVRGRGAQRYEELRDVAYGLKALAKEAGVPIVVLAQLNRSVESRNVKRPALSDLRDSGAIEEAADIVGLLYSEGYYDPECSMPYVLECAVEKNRNGPRGECLWHFAGEYSRVGVLEAGACDQYRRMRAKARRRGAADDEDL